MQALRLLRQGSSGRKITEDDTVVTAGHRYARIRN